MAEDTGSTGPRRAPTEPEATGLVMPPDLEHVVHDVMRLTPTRIEPLANSSGLRVHRVFAGERILYIKHGPARDTGGKFCLDAWAAQLCRANDVLVPEVLAASEPGDEIDYVVTLPLAGCALEQLDTGGPPTVTGDALKPILREAGQQLRLVHEIEVGGFGPIVGVPPRGAYERWSQLLDLARESLPTLVAHEVLSENDAAMLDAQFAEAHSTLRLDMTGRLLHADLTGDHLFSDCGRFTGFLDFEKVHAGDPVYDLAQLAWWDPHMLPDVIDGYGREALTSDDINIRMPAYLTGRAVATGAWLIEGETGDRHPVVRAIHAGMLIGPARERDFAASLRVGPPARAVRRDKSQPRPALCRVPAGRGRRPMRDVLLSI